MKMALAAAKGLSGRTNVPAAVMYNNVLHRSLWLLILHLTTPFSAPPWLSLASVLRLLNY